MISTEGDPEPKNSGETTTTSPTEATDLQTGVGQILVDHELEQGKTVKIPQPKRRRVVFKY